MLFDAVMPFDLSMLFVVTTLPTPFAPRRRLCHTGSVPR
ncbi:hypothetical protein Rrhod_1010 [Rhodococcus rhodnii LMG 5362]|uniref:Uncharacterized protein n=1 Tax=Rhodococcus rhodnii LMG 5362 TaxID=1273125 RepID=R7WQP2_9NOCA|nr:hypothetical protein Rrhod_1010 [Rhodococcus rhodnii LMG 5362]